MSLSNAALDGAANSIVITSPASNGQTAQADAGQQQQLEPWRNPEELKKYFKRVQTLEDENAKREAELQQLRTKAAQSQQSAPPVSADALASRMQALEAELQFRDAIAGVGNLNPKQQQVLRKLYSQDKPQNIQEWLADQVSIFGENRPPGNAASPPAPPPQAANNSNTGAPATESTAMQTDYRFLARARPDVWANMPRAERMKMFEAQLAREGFHSNVYQKKR